ncbi:MAG TPA: hypothetical protein VFV98_08675 [Vicinamibacterales bacterium]|nr:hypothetical protein [Vicinamibacterales bacterium]
MFARFFGVTSIAPTAARRAMTLGYTRVQVMSEGIKGWIDASLPTESGAGH